MQQIAFYESRYDIMIILYIFPNYSKSKLFFLSRQNLYRNKL
jgi:hypothetical protein